MKVKKEEVVRVVGYIEEFGGIGLAGGLAGAVTGVQPVGAIGAI